MGKSLSISSHCGSKEGRDSYSSVKAYKSLGEPLMTVQTVSCGTGAAILDLSHVRFHEWATVGNEGCVKSEKSQLPKAGEGLACGWAFLFGGCLTTGSVSCKLTVSIRKEDVRPQGGSVKRNCIIQKK